MAATGKTPILLYGSTTPTNAPTAGNLTNSSDGCEIAINVADKNLFFKDSTNVVNTVPIRQSSASSNGWLSSTDWNTFNGKASTSSPTFSGNVTLSTGNLVIGTSGKGITTGSAIPFGLGTNNGVASATVHNSGGVSIGNTTDPGAGNLSVTGTVVGSKVFSGGGSTASTNSGTAVTLFAAAGNAVYMVTAFIFGTGAPAAYTAVAIVKTSGSVGAVTTISSATNMTISISGLNVQATQTSGAAQLIEYQYSRLY